MALQSIFIILLAVSVLLAMILAFYAWLRRDVPGSRAFMFIMGGGMIWGLGYILEILWSSPEGKIFWDNVQFTASDMIVASVLVFVLIYTRRVKKFHRYWYFLLIEPIVALVLIWTDRGHGMLRVDPFISKSAIFPILTYSFGPIIWGWTAYQLILILISIVLLLLQFFRQHHIYHRQLIALTVGSMIPVVGACVSIMGWIPIPNMHHLDITPITFTFSSIFWAAGLYYFRILDIMPVARQTVFDEIADILIVLDPNHRIVDLNHAAASLISFPDDLIIGESIQLFLPDLGSYLQEEVLDGDPGEIQLKWNDSKVIFSVNVTPLYDHRSRLGGWMVILRDITNYKHAEEQVRLAREVADTLRQIGESLSATLDFDELLDRLLALVEQVIPYDTGSVMLIQDEQILLKRTRGYEKFGKEIASVLTGLHFQLDKFSNIHWMYAQQKPLVIPDTRDFEDWVETDLPIEVKSWVGAPIIYQGQVKGFFALEKQQPDYFASRDADHLATFSSQAALAMENARLYTEMRVDLAREQRLNEAMRSINRTMETEQIVKDVLSLCVELIQTDRADLGLIGPDGRMNRFHSIAGSAGKVEEKEDSEAPGDVFRRWMMESSEPFMMNVNGQADNMPLDLLGASVFSIIGVPLTAGTTKLGVLGLYNLDPQKQFSERDLALVESIGHQAGIAIQNSHLFKDVQRLAITDSLTGWYNRRHFFAQAQNELNRTMRYNHSLSVIMLDIDRFKRVNDTYGHLVGDHVLQAITKRIQKNLRKPDINGRYGGEEFVILLPETGILSAQQAAERIRVTIADRPVATSKGLIPVTISLGVASVQGTEIREVERLLDMADQALYAAKEAGRNRVGVWRMSGMHEILPLNIS
jgi:diguanylate cyclase (GGDEF)-like protein/PAS domain S-box-containing protein